MAHPETGHRNRKFHLRRETFRDGNSSRSLTRRVIYHGLSAEKLSTESGYQSCCDGDVDVIKDTVAEKKEEVPQRSSECCGSLQ
jgi:hypothetical protein